MSINEVSTEPEDPILDTEETKARRDKILSSLAARLFFFLLLLADLIWAAYTISIILLAGAAALITGLQVAFFKQVTLKTWISLKRASVCGLSLLIALFSPAFGIMIACTYFLMYDKKGIEEVVPASLQEQFHDFLKNSSG